jgi:hypothetical protein
MNIEPGRLDSDKATGGRAEPLTEKDFVSIVETCVRLSQKGHLPPCNETMTINRAKHAFESMTGHPIELGSQKRIKHLVAQALGKANGDICLQCGQLFVVDDSTKKFCSRDCFKMWSSMLICSGCKQVVEPITFSEAVADPAALFRCCKCGGNAYFRQHL